MGSSYWLCTLTGHQVAILHIESLDAENLAHVVVTRVQRLSCCEKLGRCLGQVV